MVVFAAVALLLFAVRMVRTGDYVTPHFADGTRRFEKPILSYWLIAASYRHLGISLFSSRLPSSGPGAPTAPSS